MGARAGMVRCTTPSPSPPPARAGTTTVRGPATSGRSGTPSRWSTPTPTQRPGPGGRPPRAQVGWALAPARADRRQSRPLHGGPPGGSRRRPVRRSPDRRPARPGLRPTDEDRYAGVRSPGAADQGPWTPGQVSLDPDVDVAHASSHAGARLGLVRRQFDDDRTGTRQPGPRLREHRLDISETGRAVGAVTRHQCGNRLPPHFAGEIRPLRCGDVRADSTRPRRPRPAIGTEADPASSPPRTARAGGARRAAGAPGPSSPGPRSARRGWPRCPKGTRQDGRGPVRWRGIVRWRPIPSRGRPRSAIAAASRLISASATSTTCSVSGLGISTRRSTNRSKGRNAQRPSTYCNGSPARRRAVSGRRWRATSAGRLSSHRAGASRAPPPRSTGPPAGCRASAASLYSSPQVTGRRPPRRRVGAPARRPSGRR